MKVALIVLAVVVGLLVALEVSLRLLLGFGNPLIYVPDEQIGYLLAPSQRTRRFGNRIEINEYSMRSPPFALVPQVGTLRVLLLGDSVANGGWWTDGADTISALMTNHLATIIQNPKVEVLNASANSWGPRNELAYLQRFGHFGARVVVLLINTDDLFGTVPSSLQVGRDRNYPSRKPPLALVEVFSRYLLPAPPVPPLPEEKGDRVARNLEAIRQIHLITRQNNAHFVLAMTPLRREIGSPGSRDYELKARASLTEFIQTEQIPYLDFLPLFNSAEQPATLYRDHIHLSPTGNQLVSQAICKALQQAILDFRF